MQGVRILLRAIGEGKVDAPEEILSRWTWRLARATRKLQDRRAGSDLPEAKRLLGALTNSRGHRHEENAARLVNVALEQPIHVAVALLASAEAYTPTAQQLIDRMRERLGTIQEVANALADNLPAPKQHSGKSRRRRRKRKQKAEQQKAQQHKAEKNKAPDAKGDDKTPERKKAEKPKPRPGEPRARAGSVSAPRRASLLRERRARPRAYRAAPRAPGRRPRSPRRPRPPR